MINSKSYSNNKCKFKTFLVFFRPVLNLTSNYKLKTKELSQQIQNHL